MVDPFALGGPITLGRILAEINSFRERHGGKPPAVLEVREAEVVALRNLFYPPADVTPSTILGIPVRIVKD